MSMLSAQYDELRTLAFELRQIREYNCDFAPEEEVTLVSSESAMREAADTIELLRDMLQDATLGSGKLTAEHVREAIEKRFDFDVWVPNERWQAIADELNATLKAGR